MNNEYGFEFYVPIGKIITKCLFYIDEPGYEEDKEKVLAWFGESKDNNIIYTYRIAGETLEKLAED